MRQHDETQRLEAEIWQMIKDDDETARIAIYLEDCAICQFKDVAQKRLDLLNAQSAVREDERLQFQSAAKTKQLSALKAYADNCVACDFQAKADDLIAGIERDSAHKSEQAALNEALTTSNADQLRAYLKDCQLCTGRDDATQALADITQRFEAAGPCLALAGLPQQGGPRKLALISIKKGRLVCGKALATYPGDPLLTVMMGRIEHAAGNFDAANAAYQVGIRAGLPSAYGLAAYLLQNPPAGVAQDSASADRLARKGAAKGDWLAREMQVVLYSQGLVSGRSEGEAFKIATDLAREDNVAGQFFLGYFYLTGTGTEASEGNALRWLGQAYEGGYSHATAYLAEIYENGSPEVASIDRAADIYWSGLEAGDQTVMDRLTDQLRERKRPIIRLIQTRLRREGLYKGEIDGVPGPGTIRAIRDIADRQNTG
jgi:TPR repeat protein